MIEGQGHFKSWLRFFLSSITVSRLDLILLAKKTNFKVKVITEINVNLNFAVNFNVSIRIKFTVKKHKF